MIERLIYIVMILLLTVSFNGMATENVIAMSDSISHEEKPEEWYKYVGKYRKADVDSVLRDSVKNVYGDKYWMLAAASGKLDLKDKTIKYPRFVKWCVDVYNWGDKTFNSYDSTYVVGTGKKWKLLARNDNWFDFYDLKLPQSIRIGMMSDIACNVGANISYMALSFGYMFNVDNVIGGAPVKHKRFDLQFSCSLIAYDAYYSKNTGNVNITQLGNYYKNYNIFNSDYKFSGLTLESYGIDMYYFFNNRKYSQGSAYSYSKYQKKSAGSFISGLTISRQNVKIDFNALPQEIIDELPSDKRNYHINYNDYCVMLGYGYNWVFKKNWLFNITLIPCVGFNHSFNDSDLSDSRRDLFSMNIKSKLALVYNHNSFFYSLTGKYDGHFYNNSKYRFINSYGTLTFLAGFRF